MKRFLRILAVVLGTSVLAFVLGPRPHFAPASAPPMTLPADLISLEKQLAQTERVAGLKPDNEARIIWADSTRKQKTAISMVYIPGFGASWAEGHPIHKQLAAHFGCNLYLARPDEHGLRSPDALKTLTPATYAASAERALAVGKVLGNEVVVLGTSAGGMLTLYLAQRHPDIKALVVYSPCIATANPGLKLATGPWGHQLLEKVMGGERVVVSHYSPDRARYWLTQYHINGLVTLQTMMDQYMTPEAFARIKQPLFLGYYYRDEENQDKVVSVPAMRTMFEALGTLPGKKQQVAFPNAGEHVIASHFTSGDLAGVYRATEAFLAKTVGITPPAGTLVIK